MADPKTWKPGNPGDMLPHGTQYRWEVYRAFSSYSERDMWMASPRAPLELAAAYEVEFEDWRSALSYARMATRQLLGGRRI